MQPLTTSQRTALLNIQSDLTEPLLYLSSEAFDWQDIIMRAFHEPTELEGWIEPAVPEVILVLMARGAMLMEVKTPNGAWQGRTIQQGDLFLRPAHTMTNELRWRSITDEPMQTVHVHVNGDLFTQAHNGIVDFQGLMRRSGFQDPLMAQIILALWRELEQPTHAGKLYAQTAAHMLAVHLMHHYASMPDYQAIAPQGLSPKQIQQVRAFVCAHLHQKLPLSVLANQVDFSPYHFARLFRQSTGESPHQFVLRQRIGHAKRLLNDSKLSLAQIALESGFANQSHLTHIFKRYVGLTPSAYRKKY